MRNLTFISPNESLRDTLRCVNNGFVELHTLIPTPVLSRLSQPDLDYLHDSFALQNEHVLKCRLDSPPKSIEQLLEEVIKAIYISIRGVPYAQVVGQQYKDHTLHMTSLNFARTIIETSPAFKTLFGEMGYNELFQMLLNYIIIVPYKGEHIQVAGQLLNDRFNMKSIGGAAKKPQANTQMEVEFLGGQASKAKIEVAKKTQEPANSRSKWKPKSSHYSQENINRARIFYSTTMNRHTGIFSKNIFFEKGLRKSQFVNECRILVERCFESHFKGKVTYQDSVRRDFMGLLHRMFEKAREILHVKEFRGKQTSHFDLLLSRHTRLPANYQQLKREVEEYIRGESGANEAELFDRIYAEHTPYKDVKELLGEFFKSVIPAELLGPGNRREFVRLVGEFIQMKRFEGPKMEDLLLRFDAFELKAWLPCNYNRKYRAQIIGYRRKHLAYILLFLVNEMLIPLLKFNFYITEKHKEANKIFYYRKPLWVLISKLSINKLAADNLEAVSYDEVEKLRETTQLMPQGKLRILPKKGTFRPIITFNRKIAGKVEGRPRMNLNQHLADTQLVLRNLKHILGEKFGYCIFDNRQISARYDAFLSRWRAQGCPELKYFTLDIKKCYDSINTSKLLNFIQESPQIDDQYLIVKYNRLYRNKKALHQRSGFTNFFNFKERTTAIPFSQDLMKLRQEYHLPAVNVFPAKQKMITKRAILDKLQKLCEGSIVSYKKSFWLQKMGIPQGLNVSGVLCSLYFACLERRYVQVHKGLLMRLTDDYVYIGPEEEARVVLDELLVMAQENDFVFSESKISKNFHHPRLPNYTPSPEFLWIGKKIHIDTLSMLPAFEMSEKVGFAMNVNHNKLHEKGFLTNKLKSLLTNHFASYFKPRYFSFPHLAQTIRLYTQISLQKFNPFLVQLLKKPSKDVNLEVMVFRVLIYSVRDFLLYACTLAPDLDNQELYRKLYRQVAGEIALFLKRRPNCGEFSNLERIFRAHGRPELAEYQS